MPKFNLVIPELPKFLEQLGLHEKHIPIAIRQALAGEGGQAIAAAARMRVKRVTGHLYRSIDVQMKFGNRFVTVGVDGSKIPDQVSSSGRSTSRRNLGTWVESGTKRHSIEPHDAQVLRIRNDTWAETVMHPGTKRQRVMYKSLRATKWELESAVIDNLMGLAAGYGWR